MGQANMAIAMSKCSLVFAIFFYSIQKFSDTRLTYDLEVLRMKKRRRSFMWPKSEKNEIDVHLDGNIDNCQQEKKIKGIAFENVWTLWTKNT